MREAHKVASREYESCFAKALRESGVDTVSICVLKFKFVIIYGLKKFLSLANNLEVTESLTGLNIDFFVIINSISV